MFLDNKLTICAICTSIHAFQPHNRGDERGEEKYFPKRHWLFEHKKSNS